METDGEINISDKDRFKSLPIAVRLEAMLVTVGEPVSTDYIGEILGVDLDRLQGGEAQDVKRVLKAVDKGNYKGRDGHLRPGFYIAKGEKLEETKKRLGAETLRLAEDRFIKHYLDLAGIKQD